jgi:UDP-glucuronate 4-epimerase
VDSFDSLYDPALKRQNVAHHAHDPNFTLVEEDIREYDSLVRRCDGDYDVIVHLAARAGVRPSIQDPLGYYDVNVRGTQNLLELAHKWGVEQFVFASSSSVYGLNPRVPWREDENVLRPISPYASTKVSGELLGHVYSHLHGIRFIGLRLFTVYGPRQRPDLAIHRFVRKMLDGEPVPIYGDGASRRDYTHVGDAVDGLWKAIQWTGSPYEIINLGSGSDVSLLEMVQMLEDVLGKRAKLEFLSPQAGDAPHTWACIEKARHLLGYNPRMSLHEGLRQFAEWTLGGN